MDWNELKTYLWKPVNVLPEAAVQVADGIFQVGDAYLFTVSYHKDMAPSQEQVISQLIWAPSLASVKRAFNLDIVSDDGATGEPPPEMRLAQRAITYSTILEEAKAQGLKLMESATYRIMTDGAFIHKQIESRKYRVYFRSRHEEPEEKPYAVAISA